MMTVTSSCSAAFSPPQLTRFVAKLRRADSARKPTAARITSAIAARQGHPVNATKVRAPYVKSQKIDYQDRGG
jgi:hypothetical protein